MSVSVIKIDTILSIFFKKDDNIVDLPTFTGLSHDNKNRYNEFHVIHTNNVL